MKIEETETETIRNDIKTLNLTYMNALDTDLKQKSHIADSTS